VVERASASKFTSGKAVLGKVFLISLPHIVFFAFDEKSLQYRTQIIIGYRPAIKESWACQVHPTRKSADKIERKLVIGSIGKLADATHYGFFNE
jgi:hypothetical protein